MGFFAKGSNGEWVARELDPGGYAQAGVEHMVKVTTDLGETITGIDGCQPIAIDSCKFTTRSTINLLARIKQERLKLTVRRSAVKAANLAVRGAGIACGAGKSDCTEIVAPGTRKLVASAIPGYEAYWKRCIGKAVKNVCSVVVGKSNVLVEAGARKK